MSEHKEVTGEDLNLIRTDLANERTLLAYGRTALMVSGTGVSILQFFSVTLIYHIIAWPLIGGGFVIGVIGVVRFTKLSRRLHAD
ncbi:membrane protein containing [Rhodopirellula maiorica SM1]|uniref:Membrane protein containing n=1 Tax=Rhodopirellula maiorica SM1 TaxID=1265738 RepID=M5RSZ4_9BACT|nr:DUF202 domain-containing protein [Rhodopirellula maiorica]EMI22463.1 membrane protein containing [Rhodopirellula maiorica SM1]